MDSGRQMSVPLLIEIADDDGAFVAEPINLVQQCEIHKMDDDTHILSKD